MDIPLRDRRHAGLLLARRLKAFENSPSAIVMGLPRGGVPVAGEIARALHLPLDVCLVRKLGTPGNPELAMGAVASGGVVFLNHGVLEDYQVPRGFLDREIALEREEVERRERAYRGDTPQFDLIARTVIVVDDGIATGSTVEAAVRSLRMRHADQVILAVGVAPAAVVRRLSITVPVVAALCPERLSSVGEWYVDFTQVTDAEVREWLRAAREARSENAPGGSGSSIVPPLQSIAASHGRS